MDTDSSDTNPAGYKLVYIAKYQTASHRVLALLAENGLSPISIFETAPSLNWYYGAVYENHIAVPEDCVEEARALLEDWEKTCTPQAAENATKFAKLVIPVAAITLLIFFIALIFAGTEKAMMSMGIIIGACFNVVLLLMLIKFLRKRKYNDGGSGS